MIIAEVFLFVEREKSSSLLLERQGEALWLGVAVDGAGARDDRGAGAAGAGAMAGGVERPAEGEPPVGRWGAEWPS